MRLTKLKTGFFRPNQAKTANMREYKQDGYTLIISNITLFNHEYELNIVRVV